MLDETATALRRHEVTIQRGLADEPWLAPGAEQARILAAARTLDEVKTIRDKAEAMASYFRNQAGEHAGWLAQVTELKLRAERRLGELLARMPKNPGGGDHRFHDVTGGPATLDELGVSKIQSHRWQRIARVPVAAFETYLARQRGAGQEPTTADLLRMAPKNGSSSPSAPVPAVITLSDWHAMVPRERERVIREAPRDARRGMNLHAEEDGERAIEWALWSRNVVTGCLHDCPYCYARDIAERFYPHGFEPAFHPERLHSPRNVRVPLEARTSVGHKNVFSDSMADLFGKWVPQPWIDAELSVARACPQWNFLYLTKFPQRLAEQDWSPNAWCGTSVDRQARVAAAERAFRGVRGAGVRWLSCEPMLERLTFASLEMFDWVVVGGATASTRTPVFRPPAEWVEHLIAQARDAGCRVYLKQNLRYRREYPEGPVTPL
jgi:protein gp37